MTDIKRDCRKGQPPFVCLKEWILLLNHRIFGLVSGHHTDEGFARIDFDFFSGGVVKVSDAGQGILGPDHGDGAAVCDEIPGLAPVDGLSEQISFFVPDNRIRILDDDVFKAELGFCFFVRMGFPKLAAVIFSVLRIVGENRLIAGIAGSDLHC